MSDFEMNTANPHLDVASFELCPGTTLIEASAGTGKTYTIQYIVLDLLLKGLSLPEVLVVTFTEAATKELTDRLQSFLVEVNEVLMSERTENTALAAVLERAVSLLGRDTVKRFIRKAMLDIDQASIFTIHGFCQRALQENAFAADANFDSELCADLTPIVEELVMDFLRRVHVEMPTPPPTVASLGALTARASRLTGMLRIKNPFIGDLCSISSELDQAAAAIQLYAPQADAIVAEFKGYEGQLKATTYKPAFFEGFESLLHALLRDPLSVAAKDVSKLGARTICAAFKRAYEGAELQSEFFAACDALAQSRAEYEPNFLQCFDTWFIETFSQLKQERGILTYNDMIFDLDRALMRSERLKQQLQDRYRAALVDEFQDTDSRQYSIFRTLFGDSSGSERFFAMIGDPKQSIYGFRGADISAYLEARELADYSYTLPMNYRSVDAVVTGTNRFFEGSDLGVVLGGNADESIRFEAVSAKDTPKERLRFAGNVEVDRLYERALEHPQDDKVGTVLATSVRSMAADVHRLLQLSEEGRVYFESEVEGRNHRRAVHPGDIAVLVEDKNQAADIQVELQKYGIVAVRSKTGSIIGTPEAKDFLYFLMACLDPSERLINLLLISPLYGKNDSGLRSMSDAEYRKVYETFTMFGTLWRDGVSVSVIWNRFLGELSLSERLLEQAEGERQLTNYLHIAEFAQELERMESLSPERLRDRLWETIQNGAVSSQEDEYLVRLESDGRAVKIMTMHGSKGLEFPIVFLPSLWQRGINKNSKTEQHLLTEVDDPDCFVGFEADSSRVIAAASSESLRLGYVAMTRAVHLCVYYNARELPKQHGGSNHANGWFDKWLYDQRGESYSTEANQDFLVQLSGVEPVELSPEERPLELHTHKLIGNISASYQITSYSSLARSEQTPDADPTHPSGSGDRPVEPENSRAETESAANDSDLLLRSLPGGVRTGTCVHEILERCDFTEPDSWERLARSVIERHFPEGGDSVLEDRVQQVLDLLTVLTQQARVGPNGWSIDLSQLTPSACIPEMEFYFPVEQVDLSALEGILQRWGARVGLEYAPAQYRPREIDGYLTGSVDLFFTQGQRYFILDWKTNRPLRGHSGLRSGYDRAGMHAHMVHGRYYLQALIYSVAASAYLRHMLDDQFDWETHMGGFVYCFVRGLGESSGWHHEAFSEAEVLEASQALGQFVPKKGVA